MTFFDQAWYGASLYVPSTTRIGCSGYTGFCSNTQQTPRVLSLKNLAVTEQLVAYSLPDHCMCYSTFPTFSLPL